VTFARTVVFGRARVGVIAEGDKPERLAEFACRHLPTEHHVASEVGEASIVLRLTENDGVFALHGDPAEAFSSPFEYRALEQLLRRITFFLIDTHKGGLLFHAAVVSERGRAILMPGVSGAGKSTLTTQLVRSGFGLATDELALLPQQPQEAGRPRAPGLTRPIHLKAPSLFAVRGELLANTGSTPHSSIVWSDEGAFVHAEALGGHVAQPSSIAAVVLPRYVPGEATFAPLSAARATRELMGHLVNARNLEGHGFQEVAKLAREVPAFALSYHQFPFAEAWLRALCQSDSSAREAFASASAVDTNATKVV